MNATAEDGAPSLKGLLDLNWLLTQHSRAGLRLCRASRCGLPDGAGLEVPAHSKCVKQQSNRQCEQQCIDAVQNAAVSRKQRPGIFDSSATLQRRLDQVSNLRGNIHANSEPRD